MRTHGHHNRAGKRQSVVIGGKSDRNLKVLPEDYANEVEAWAAAAEFARVPAQSAGQPCQYFLSKIFTLVAIAKVRRCGRE